ncbi:MAG: hypothetical protein KGJ32_00885 [Xanthomonadaceae bacterium]|nr:hypothetical protein [Xanthomonadaceae bacterium]
MSHYARSCDKDLLGSRWATGLLWIAPWVLIVLGANAGTVVHTAVWTISFTVMGMACLVNARRCGRRHCFYTGPLFLLAALLSVLYGLGILPLGRHGWNWISGIAVAGAVLACCGLEMLMGKYTARHSQER